MPCGMRHTSFLVVGRYVPTKVIRVHNKAKPWFDDQCRHAFDLKQEAHLRWTRDRSRVNWAAFVRYQVRAKETYSEAKHQFSDRNRDVLKNVQSPHKWWSTRLVRLICCRIILTSSSPGRLLICSSLVIRLPALRLG